MLKPFIALQLIKRSVSSAEPLRNRLGSKMQAWQIHSYGDLSELQLCKARVPMIQSPSDVLVNVHASSLNPIDKMLIKGYGKELLGFLRNYDLEFPLTLGRDFSGTVVDKGHGVREDLKIGDEVFGILAPHKQGSHSDVVLCNQETIAKKPNNLSHIEVASLAYASVTAWSALYITGELCYRNPKDTNVLILGASGGVGTAATQILKSQGSKVIGTCSSDAISLLKSLGADEAFDYNDKDYVQNVSRCGNYDIILDCAKIGYQNLPNQWNYKRYITLNSPLLENADKYGFVGGMAVNAGELLRSNVYNVTQGKTVRWGFVIPSNKGVEFIKSLMVDGKLCPVIQKVFKFEEMPKAYEMLTKGHLRGKIVIDFCDS